MDNYLLPVWIYRLIPFIYIGLGIYIWLKLDMVYALIPGAMMLGAGVLVLLMRRQVGSKTINEKLARLRSDMVEQEI